MVEGDLSSRHTWIRPVPRGWGGSRLDVQVLLRRRVGVLHYGLRPFVIGRPT